MKRKHTPSLSEPQTRFLSRLPLWAVLLLGLFIIVLSSDDCKAQPWSEILNFPGGQQVGLTANKHHLNVASSSGYFLLLWNPDRGKEIVGLREKFGVFGRYLVVLSDGSVFQFDVSSTSATRPTLLSNLPGGQDWRQIAGDALYAVAFSGNIFVSRNNGGSWQIDTSGLSGASVNQVALDTAQFVYAVTNKGLFKQHPDTSFWRRVDSLYIISANQKTYPDFFSLHVDRRNFIYVNRAYSGTYVSRNNGLTWSFDTVGIGNRPISDFGEDKLGNVYVITTGSDNRIYRTADSGRTWIRIDLSLVGMRLDPNNLYPFTDIEGDSILALATTYGFFLSSNQGTSWIEFDGGPPDLTLNSYLRVGNRTVISTDRGILYRGPSDTDWIKSFPTNGYLSGLKPYRDGGGNLYTAGEAPNTTSPHRIYKSTDAGTSWAIDTAGYFAVRRPGIHYADELGNQYYAAQEQGNIGVRLYKKPSSGPWSLDTAGFKSTSSLDKPYAFQFDKAGSIYVSGKFSGGGMWKRPVGGSTWTLDTAGLGTRLPEVMTVDKNGNPLAIVVVEFPKRAIFRRTSGTWARLTHPAAGPSASRISVDSTNTLWASLYDDPFGDPGIFEVDNRGIHVTTNNGATWTKVGVDSTVILGLVSYGDTTYALTQGRGLYAMKSTGVLSEVQSDLAGIPQKFSLSQNFPNPFNPSTTIEFNMPSASHVRLRIFDLLGREVASLLNEEMTAGRHRAEWNASKFSSGVYFYRIEAGAFLAVRKLVLLK